MNITSDEAVVTLEKLLLKIDDEESRDAIQFAIQKLNSSPWDREVPYQVQSKQRIKIPFREER